MIINWPLIRNSTDMNYLLNELIMVGIGMWPDNYSQVNKTSLHLVKTRVMIIPCKPAHSFVQIKLSQRTDQ